MNKKQRKTLCRIIISVVLLALVSTACHFIDVNKYVEAMLFLMPYLVIGYDILKKAFKSILNRQVFDENFLMAVATVGAIALGDYKEAAAVIIFYQIGELFQSCAVGKSRKNIAALMDIRPDYANILVDGKIEKVDPDEVLTGSEIVVNPGEKIPIDGVIVEGNSTIDTSALTGESIPVEKLCGDEVISGSINLTGVLKIKTTKEFEESTVSKILELVENSSMKKSRSENFITKFAKYYTPAVCCGAMALAILGPVARIILGMEPMWDDWIVRALTFLVISCPCALVISIPLSFFGGIGCASSNGILVKGTSYLEILSNAKYMVFDKTGTLTRGVFEVEKINPESGITEEELLEIAAYAESGSNHPISISLKKAYGKDMDLSRISDIKEVAGHGIVAGISGKTVHVGNGKLMRVNEIAHKEEEGKGTIVYVAIDGVFAGSIHISDIVKKNTKYALAELKKNGIYKTVMLTGDRRQTAEIVANEIGIDVVKSELLPGDKVDEVERLLEEKGEKEILVFVGDGINDAPVLSRADIGIAMGALGSDAAIEAADVVLMDDDPAKIALAMKISRKTLKIVKQNIVFALFVKAVCLVLGAIGLANMWLAIFADVGVMVIAVLNATRALRIKNDMKNLA